MTPAALSHGARWVGRLADAHPYSYQQGVLVEAGAWVRLFSRFSVHAEGLGWDAVPVPLCAQEHVRALWDTAKECSGGQFVTGLSCTECGCRSDSVRLT